MIEFIEHIKTKYVSNEQIFFSENSFAIELDWLEKNFPATKRKIEEFMISGEYSLAKEHLANVGNNIRILYEKINQIEQEEKKNCNCIKAIDKNELNLYIKKIGGLEYGYGNFYTGKNKIRKMLFNVVERFFSNSKIKNPFRSKIYSCDVFDINPGWYGLLKKIFEELISDKWDKKILRITTNYGGLRFYISDNSAHNEIITKYEELSFKICEECGEAGILRKKEFFNVTCDKHKK